MLGFYEQDWFNSDFLFFGIMSSADLFAREQKKYHCFSGG